MGCAPVGKPGYHYAECEKIRDRRQTAGIEDRLQYFFFQTAVFRIYEILRTGKCIENRMEERSSEAAVGSNRVFLTGTEFLFGIVEIHSK